MSNNTTSNSAYLRHIQSLPVYTKDQKGSKKFSREDPCHVLHHTSEQVRQIGWYDALASNFSTDQRRAKLFFHRVDADLVADQLRRMYTRLAQDIEVTPAVQPTALFYSSDRRNRVAII